MSVCVVPVWLGPRQLENGIDPLELELLTVFKLVHVRVGTKSLSPARTASALPH